MRKIVKKDYKVGDKVIFINKRKHKEYPEYYPKVGTVGTVKATGKTDAIIKWERNSTSKDDRWWADYEWIIPAEEYHKKEKEKSNMKEKTTEFKVGDRVRLVKDYDSAAKAGMAGILAVKKGHSLGVRFDRPFERGHSLSGNCEAGYGYWVTHDCLELISNNKIIITTDGKTTTARLYDGKNVIKTAKAECSPEDDFFFEVGAKLAFDRLMSKKKPNSYSGKVVFLKPVGCFREKVIYVFNEDGTINSFDGKHFSPFGHSFKSFAEIEETYGKGNMIEVE